MKDIKAIFCDGSVIVGGVKRSAGKYSKILLNAFTDKKGGYIIERKLGKEYAAIAKALEFLLCPDILIEVSDIAENLINCISAIKKADILLRESWKKNMQLLQKLLNPCFVLKCLLILRVLPKI